MNSDVHSQVTLLGIFDGEDKSSPLGNRIRKNYRHVRKWAKRTKTDCFRVYDREIPNYPLIIDYYAGRFCVHYCSRQNDHSEAPEALKNETETVLGRLFGVSNDAIYWRTRARSKKTRQYEKSDSRREFFSVFEYGIKFKVNLLDYLDTGLFLDHRETRKMVSKECQGKDVLNLFAYTCSFSIHAAVGGARYTKSVDMSNTYSAWGRDNFVLNEIPLSQHDIVRADCLKFLDEEIRAEKKYDIIIIDPPTISRSKKMDQLFDIQTDYLFLLSKSLNLLRKNGVIFFSTNSRRFVLDAAQFPYCSVVDVSDKTIPDDFHDSKIHRCWRITLLP